LPERGAGKNDAVNPLILDAMWAGDVNKLDELAPCCCCCDEHTFMCCEARQWGGCRGQYSPDEQAEQESWQRHYAMVHGMSAQEFWGS
jgi:hypothetical protein